MSDEQEKSQEPELVEFTVDGRAIKAAKGTNLLQAMLDAGEEVSYFCYHRGLSIAACCRQCLVRVGGRMVPACQNTVSEGAEVLSNSDESVLDARRRQLEYTLVNHPLDCVICDKAGECALQRLYMDWDGTPSAANTEKVSKPKKIDLGPTIILDAERCIMCGRCVRFSAEIAKAPQLTFAQRANHQEISVAPGHKLDHAYSLNVVDICPVGALTDKQFRFKSRVWDLYATVSVCNGCAKGCNMEIHHKDGEIFRTVPPKKWDMNENWMCDYGRGLFDKVTKNRMSEASIDNKSADLDKAITNAAEALKTDGVGVVIGADLSNEDNFAATRFAQDVLKGGQVYMAETPDNDKGDDILRKNDPNPNRAGAKAVGGGSLRTIEQLHTDLDEGKLKALYVLSGALELSKEAKEKVNGLDFVLVQATHNTPIAKMAKIILPAATWAEVDGTITNCEGEIQRMRPAVEPPGFARPHWDLVARIATQMGSTLPFDSAEALFESMKEKVNDFKEASWGEVIPTTQLRFASRRG